MKSILNLITKTSTFLNDLLDTIDKKIANNFLDRLQKIKDYDFLVDLDKISIADSFEYVHMLSITILLFDEIRLYFKDMEQVFVSDVSRTFRMEISNAYTNIIKIYIVFRDKADTTKQQIIDDFKVSDVDDEMFKKIRTIIRTFKYSVDLYAKILENSDFSNKYALECEIDKNFYLGIDTNDIKKDEKQSVTKISIPILAGSYLTKYGIPGTLLDVLSQVIEVKKKNIEQICERNNCKIFILRSCDKSVTQYVSNELIGKTVPLVIDSSNIENSKTIKVFESSASQCDSKTYEFQLEYVFPCKDSTSKNTCKFNVVLYNTLSDNLKKSLHLWHWTEELNWMMWMYMV
jgi:hypothetical protein